jgi:alanine racemase
MVAVMDPSADTEHRAEIVVDLDAIRHNVATLKQRVGDARVMAVVKADGYGHGLVPAARAARAGGADWLGAAVLEEALALREAGDTGRLLTWLAVPGEDYRPALAADVDVTAYTVAQLDAIATAAGAVGVTARVQLKIDTGLSRGGSAAADWPALVAAAAEREREGAVTITGVWTHPACADEPDHPANDAQEDAFRDALEVADKAGLRPEVRHFANSAAALLRPSARFDLVRCGIACYGLSPAPQVATSAELGLVPAMTVRARLAVAKPVPAGAGVSYGHRYLTDRATEIGVVPVGYADGIPRHGSGRAPLQVAGRRLQVAGTICMDQFSVDLGDLPAAAGDEVLLFGPGTRGEPTAQDWAEACGTIGYEIVTRVGGRRRRRYVGEGTA